MVLGCRWVCVRTALLKPRFTPQVNLHVVMCCASVTLLLILIGTCGLHSKESCLIIRDRDVTFPHNVDLSSRVVDVVLLVDGKISQSLLNVINSVAINTKASVRFHIGICGITAAKLRSFLRCFSVENVNFDQIHIFEYDEKLMNQVKFDRFSRLKRNEVSDNLATCGNYMRFFLPILLPNISKIVYLDTDMIVQGDIAELDHYTRDLKSTLAVTKRRNYEFKLADAFPKEVKMVYESTFAGSRLDLKQTSFCAGVFVANLDKWRDIFKETIKKLNYWIEVAQNQSQIENLKPWWYRPTQSLMQLVFNEDYHWIPDRNWHSEGLGYFKNLCDLHLTRAKLLHWNGRIKPWTGGRYRKYWESHSPLQCQGRGQCTITPTAVYNCVCEDNFTGHKCDVKTTENYHPFAGLVDYKTPLK